MSIHAAFPGLCPSGVACSLHVSRRLQLRGSGGVSPRFPTPCCWLRLRTGMERPAQENLAGPLENLLGARTIERERPAFIPWDARPPFGQLGDGWRECTNTGTTEFSHRHRVEEVAARHKTARVVVARARNRAQGFCSPQKLQLVPVAGLLAQRRYMRIRRYPSPAQKPSGRSSGSSLSTVAGPRRFCTGLPY
jgi:hypothetical protein